MAARFGNASAEDMIKLNDAKDSQNTKKAVSQAVKILREYCVSMGQGGNFEDLPLDELDKLLENFYINVRKQDSTLYKASAFNLLRFGINKHLKKNKNLDIANDKIFAKSNQMYLAVCSKLKKEGLALKVHKTPITNGDMRLLYQSGVFDPTNPTGLIRKVFFEVMFFLCRRGRQNLREMTPASLKIVVDEDGFKYVCMGKDEMTKNHRKADDASSESRMYALAG